MTANARPDNQPPHPYPRPCCDQYITPALVAVMRSDESFSAVAEERIRQVMMWGPQDDIQLSQWLCIITEELGEAALCVNEINLGRQPRENMQDLYRELTQVAAVSISAMQALSLRLDAEGLLPPTLDTPTEPNLRDDVDIAVGLADSLVRTSAADLSGAEYYLCALTAAYRALLGTATPTSSAASLTPLPLGEGPGVRETPPAVRTCRVCGCTDDRGCPGGCFWVDPDLCSACVDAVAKPAPPVPPIPASAWREHPNHAQGTTDLIDLGFIVSPDPPLPNIVDVRGDVTHSTDGTSCAWGLKVKCRSGHNLQLRGRGRNRAAARASLEAAYPTLAAWAASLGGE